MRIARSSRSHRARPVIRRRLGATSTEYILILIVIVLPIAALMPAFKDAIKTYGQRVTDGLQLPFP